MSSTLSFAWILVIGTHQNVVPWRTSEKDDRQTDLIGKFDRSYHSLINNAHNECGVVGSLLRADLSNL